MSAVDPEELKKLLARSNLSPATVRKVLKANEVNEPVEGEHGSAQEAPVNLGDL